MAEFRAQAIVLKKLLSDKDVEIQKLKNSVQDTQKIMFDCLSVVYNKSETIISDIYTFCILTLGLEIQPDGITLQQIRHLLTLLLAQHTNRRIANVIQKMNILIYAIELGRPPSSCKKKLELLLLELKMVLTNPSDSGKIYIMSHNLINNESLLIVQPPVMVKESPSLESLKPRTEEKAIQTNGDKENPVVLYQHIPESLKDIRLKQFSEALQDLVSK